MSKLFAWYDAWRGAPLTCSGCGWIGQLDPTAIDVYRELADFTCPKCQQIVAIISFPTEAEIEEAAARSHSEAVGELPRLRERQRREASFEAHKLKGPDQLPDLQGDSLAFSFDAETTDGETYYVVRLGEREVWRELGHWEGWTRFGEIKTLLKAKYGRRFSTLRPTASADQWLHGDDGSLGNLEYE